MTTDEAKRHADHPRRIAFVLAIGAIAFVAAQALDRPALAHLRSPGATDADWGRALRVLGWWPLWIVVGLVLALHDAHRPLAWPLRDRWTRAAVLVLGSGLSGLLAEGLKLAIRRERPGLAGGLYEFRPFLEAPFSTSGLGLPSSHAAVAFGAAFALSRLHPAQAPLWIALAAGCALQRVLAGAHFLSDTLLAAIAAWAVVAIVWHAHLALARRAVGAVRSAGAEGAA